MTALLRAENLSKHFGGIRVTEHVSLELTEGEIHCLIGPNGAGKTTLFRLILGSTVPDEGRILFGDEDITSLPAFRRIRRGISVKFQVPGVFPALGTAQNLAVALNRRGHDAAAAHEIERLLAMLDLEHAAERPAGLLSHGEKQWLEIGMAVALKPRLLLLDEPTAGMSPEETERTGRLVQRLAADNMTVLAVEHDMAFVRQVAQRVTVLHLGRVFAQGSMDAIVADERVAAIYFGDARA